MAGGELPSVTSRTLTDTVGRADLSAMEGIVIDSSRPRAEMPLSRSTIREDDRRENGDGIAASGHPSLPSSVIHELRTPLTSIHGYAQVLQRTLRNEPRAANALSVVIRESTRLSGMLAALSELAELESTQELPPPMAVATEEIVDEAIHEVSRRDAHAHPLELTGRGIARCHPSNLSQAVVHVLTNAVRYSDAGAPVSVTISDRGTSVVIEVADRGIGIEYDDAERVYEPFQRGSLARQAGIRGLGLGLHLARAALRQYGGWLEHEARDGGGTIFRITLPRA